MDGSAPFIGILMLDTRFERFPGDVGHPATWPFPVRFRIVPGAGAEEATGANPARLLEPFGMVWINQALMRGKGRNWAFAAVGG